MGATLLYECTMRITRRNTLIVLLVIVAAGGIAGTGAFSSVSADRSISVDSTGDTGANVQLSVNTAAEGLTDGGTSDTIGLDFNNLNKNANTTYNNALEITPQGDSDSYDISVVDSSEPSNVDINVKNGNGVSAGASVNASVSIDLKGDNTASEIGSDETITISVTQAS